MPEVWGQTKEQLCWLHKTRNILNKLPKREHEAAADRLRAIYLAEDKTEAVKIGKKADTGLEEICRNRKSGGMFRIGIRKIADIFGISD